MSILILFLLFLVFYVVIENYVALALRREKLGEGIKIAHISDLHKKHFGRDNINLCQVIQRDPISYS